MRRLPPLSLQTGIELGLLLLIAVQAARLAWLAVTPLDPVGDYRGSASTAPAGPPAALAAFDPFFRLSAGGPVVVTSLTLKLHGIREDRATGRGSAIIALPNGTQSSFAVGEEIMPGVTLAAVGSDSVTINRNGVSEQVFLDQSEPASPETATATAAPAPATQPPPPGQAQSPIRMPVPANRAPAPRTLSGPAEPASRLQARQLNGRGTGISVNAAGDGGRTLRAAGFEDGDVIVSVDGQRVTSMEQARALARRSGGPSTIIVNRGGRAVPLRVRLDL